MKTLNHILITLALVPLIVGCGGSQAAVSIPVPDPGYWPTDGWRTSSPEEQGMDSALLAQLFERIQRDQINLHSVLIVRNGYLVTEAYFHPYTADIRHQVASVTKSVISSLIGIAIDHGYIRSVDQSLLGFFSDRGIANVDARKQAITLKHLLNMTSSLKCKDRSGTDAEMQRSSDWIQFMLDLPMEHTPGAEFSYCSGGPLLLSAILEKATGLNTRDFANTHLFAPLGIPSVSDAEWGSDPQGYALGGYGLYLTPRNMAKLGYLYLNQGQWAGQQIVSSDWVTISTQQHSMWEEQNRAYGYLWWLYPAQGYYSAMGLGGQQIHVDPRLNLVVVFTSALGPSAEDYLDRLLNDYIIPAVKANTALPANPGAAAHLESHIQALQPSRQAVPPLPPIALRVSGKTYALEHNSLNWQQLSLAFHAGGDVASLTIDSSGEVAIGLDNVFRVTEIPGLGPTAMRGRWARADTFIIEAMSLGNPVESKLEVTFSGREIKGTLEDIVFGGMKVNLYGTSQN